jgi:two-component system, NarL family, sensor kinase
VQEALTNVHRHAGASHVSVKARVAAGRLVVRIRDDGHGMAEQDRPAGHVRFGVGIRGMRARLEQFGGALRIRTGRSGTSVIATVPIRGAGRLPPRAGRLRMPWQSGRAKADSEASS